VAITVAWIGLVSVVGFAIAKQAFGGLRVSEDAEREGLDIATHGETAYQS
jgi:Amt family ammonium transporter